MTAAVVLPPAVLVRFLTRRFIGEYASNASKCFQVGTQAGRSRRSSDAGEEETELWLKKSQTIV